MNIKLGLLSARIKKEEAIKGHIDYLSDPRLHILTPTTKIAHSLYVDEGDLATLYEYGKKGMRLYFCKHESDQALNIILVPVDVDGNNCVETPLGQIDPPIVNTLRPCPDDCPPLNAAGAHTTQQNSLSTTDLNCVEVGGNHYWYKPNFPDAATGRTWYDKDNNPVDDPRP